MTPLEKLAISAGVSYRSPPTADEIAEMIRSGAIAPTFLAHMAHILKEAPPQLWSMAAAAMEDPAQALRNIAAMRASLTAPGTDDGIDPVSRSVDGMRAFLFPRVVHSFCASEKLGIDFRDDMLYHVATVRLNYTHYQKETRWPARNRKQSR